MSLLSELWNLNRLIDLERQQGRSVLVHYPSGQSA